MSPSLTSYQVHLILNLFRNLLGHNFVIIFLVYSLGENIASAAAFPRNEAMDSSGI